MRLVQQQPPSGHHGAPLPQLTTAIQLAPAPAGAGMTGGAAAAALALPQGAVYQAQLPAGVTLQAAPGMAGAGPVGAPAAGQYLQVNGQTVFVTAAPRPLAAAAQSLASTPAHHQLDVKPPAQLDGLDDELDSDSDDSDDSADAVPRRTAAAASAKKAAAGTGGGATSHLVVRPKMESRDELEDEDLLEDEELDDDVEDEEVSAGAGAAEDDTKEGQEIGPPLNSDDDVSDEETEAIFDTDNVVVCQYDKISRTRNKWKFIFKDGIMNLNGKDYVFQRANGDAEW